MKTFGQYNNNKKKNKKTVSKHSGYVYSLLQ